MWTIKMRIPVKTVLLDVPLVHATPKDVRSMLHGRALLHCCITFTIHHSSGCGGSPVSTCPPRSVTHCHRQQRRGDGGGRCRSAAAAAARSVWPLPSHLGRCAGVFPIKLIAPTHLPTFLPTLLTSLCTGFLPQFRTKGNKPPLAAAARAHPYHTFLLLPSLWSFLCRGR